MFYKAAGTGAGLGLAYLLTGNFWFTLLGGALGYLTGEWYEETASVKSVKEAYPEYPAYAA